MTRETHSNTRRGSKPKHPPYGKDSTPGGNKSKEMKDIYVDYHNDFMWYNKHADYLASVAKVSSNHARGTTLGKLIEGEYNPAVTTTYHNEPTVSSIIVAPTGCGQNNPVMHTAQVAFYQFIRAANSGSRNYETADLFMYLFGIKEYISFLGFVKRLILTLQYYEVNDRTVPGALLLAQIGTRSLNDGRDLAYYLSEHKYDLLAKLNSWISQFNTLAIPNNIPLFQRAYWMFNHIYKTDDNLKPTYACYAPACFLEYDETGSENGGRLIVSDLSTDLRSAYNPDGFYKALILLGDRLLSRLMMSEDIAIISGDIRKAFGDSGLMLIAPLNIDKEELKIHDAQEIKDQMHNARLWGSALKISDNPGDYSIEQRNGYIYDNTLVTYHGQEYSCFISPRAPIVDIDKNDVDVATFVEATRLTGAIDVSTYRVYTDFWAPFDCYIYTLSDEVGAGVDISINITSMIDAENTTEDFCRLLTGNTEYIPLGLYADDLVRFSGDAFESESTSDTWTGTAQLLNPIHNVFRTTEVALKNIMEATILSELNIPFIKG